eukprot:8422699-Heterocapsa_arctica.AAC.1
MLRPVPHPTVLGGRKPSSLPTADPVLPTHGQHLTIFNHLLQNLTVALVATRSESLELVCAASLVTEVAEVANVHAAQPDHSLRPSGMRQEHGTLRSKGRLITARQSGHGLVAHADDHVHMLTYFRPYA